MFNEFPVLEAADIDCVYRYRLAGTRIGAGALLRAQTVSSVSTTASMVKGTKLPTLLAVMSNQSPNLGQERNFLLWRPGGRMG
jgi:hypothetical protein